jgi:hypothetical protein
MLTQAYKKALQALKDQARAAELMLEPATKDEGRTLLRDAHQRMSEHSYQVQHIMGLVSRSRNDQDTIPTLTESRLLELAKEQ